MLTYSSEYINKECSCKDTPSDLETKTVNGNPFLKRLFGYPKTRDEMRTRFERPGSGAKAAAKSLSRLHSERLMALRLPLYKLNFD